MDEEKILEINDVKGTPFKSVKFEEDGNIYLVIGNVRLETDCNDFSDVKEWVNNNQWDCIGLLCQAIAIIINNKNN